MNTKRFASWILIIAAAATSAHSAVAGTQIAPYGISYQVNVDAAGHNIAGDAANEPSMCIDPLNPYRMAVGWRQFDSTNSNFRQSGVAFTRDGGLTWTFPGSLEPGTFRSDPVLMNDGDGNFYYLGITNTGSFACDLLRSADGGATWQRVGQALGGDKEWMAIDTTTGPGRGNIYQVWSPFYNIYNNPNQIFTRSTDGGVSWMPPIALPHSPYWGTIDIGPNGEFYAIGTDGATFWVNRSTNAWDRSITPVIDLTSQVDLGGRLVLSLPGINPVGLIGQVWIAVDRSTGATRGNVYALCSVTNDPGNLANVMFSRSTDGGRTWSAALRINDDSAYQRACHWFGTLSVAPHGRIDVCWNDTRRSPNNTQSELYYSWSEDGGLSWAPNRQISPQFNHSLGYPQQNKIGDYIAMTSLNEGACIAYTGTFNGEQDIYFVRPELPIVAQVILANGAARISWNTVPGVSYCVLAKPDLALPWSEAVNVACITATNSVITIQDAFQAAPARKFYRVVRQP